jgi:hypothetical protein
MPAAAPSCSVLKQENRHDCCLEKQKLFKTLFGASGGASGRLRKPGCLMSRKHVSP